MRRRPSAGFVVSIALHVAVIAALARFTFGGHGLWGILDRDPVPIPVERIGFVSLPDRGVDDTPGQRGGDGRPITRRVEPPPRLVAPDHTPMSVPPVSLERLPADRGGRGPLVGGGGPLRGIQPSYSDPRLWTGPTNVVVAPTLPKSLAELVDSSVIATVQAYLDSMAALPEGREPGDWTFERGGKTWGIDRQGPGAGSGVKYIHLGDIKIPTALLALIPLDVQANPTMLEREKRLAQMRADIDWNATLGEVDIEFRSAVKRIRERWLRERAERQQSPP